MSKKIVYGLVAFCLVSAVFSVGKEVSALPAVAPWTEGKTWCYKWEISYADVMTKVMESMPPEVAVSGVSIDHWASGGIVEMLTITYNGMQGGNYKFSYNGGIYSKGKIGMGMSGTYEGRSMSATYETTINKMDCSFSGTLDVIDCDTYYGIANQTVSSTGTVDMSMSMDMSGGGMTESASGTVLMTWTLVLNISYGGTYSYDLLPWLPKSTPINVSNYVYATYDGYITGHVKMDITAEGFFAQALNIDEEISESISGTDYMWNVKLRSGSATVEKPSPEFGSSSAGSYALYGKAQNYSYGSSPVSGIESQSKGELSSTDSFYSSLELGGNETSTPGASSYTGSLSNWAIKSSPATTGEVNSFLANKEGYYNTASPAFQTVDTRAGKGGDNWLWIMLTVACVVSATVIIVVVLLIRMRKRRQYMPSYAPPIVGLPIEPQPPYYQPPMPPQQQPPPQPYQQVTSEIPSPRLISCPHCGLKGSVSSSHRGKVRCPGCGGMFEV